MIPTITQFYLLERRGHVSSYGESRLAGDRQGWNVWMYNRKTQIHKVTGALLRLAQKEGRRWKR
jgi:hypothetical protein